MKIKRSNFNEDAQNHKMSDLTTFTEDDIYEFLAGSEQNSNYWDTVDALSERFGLDKDVAESYVFNYLDNMIDDDEYINEDNESDSSEYEYVSSKSVLDSDGFYTDYTWYRRKIDGLNVFVFGDNELYRPEDEDWDWETESDKVAQEWFDNYHGFEDEDAIESSTKIYLPFKMEGQYQDGFKAEVSGWDESDCISKLIDLSDKHGELTYYTGINDEDYVDGEYVGRDNFIRSATDSLTDVQIENEKIPGPGEMSEMYRQGDEQTFEPGSPEYNTLADLADELREMSPNAHEYIVQDVYLDFGANWMWTTVVDTDKGVQVMNPRQWLNLLNGKQSVQDIANEILNGRFCCDKSVNASSEISEELVIDEDTYRNWYNQPILHDEDDWDGRYRTYGEMWEGEGYSIENSAESSVDDIVYVLFESDDDGDHVIDAYDDESQAEAQAESYRHLADEGITYHTEFDIRPMMRSEYDKIDSTSKVFCSESTTGYYRISHKSDNEYQSLLVKAESTDEARQKYEDAKPDGEILGISPVARGELEECRRKGMPILSVSTHKLSDLDDPDEDPEDEFGHW